MRQIVIQPQQQGKGRSFSSLLLASVEADALWSGGMADTDVQRPIWAMFAGSDPELRAFTANLMTGRKAELLKNGYSYRRKSDKVEFLKSVGYQYTWQREAEGSVVTVFLPELFRMDPGMVDPTGARFVCLPSATWTRQQSIQTSDIVRHVMTLGSPLPEAELAPLVPLAFLFSAYLDRRTRCPLVSDGRFYLQLMLACLKDGLASWSGGERAGYYDRPFGVHGHHRFTETDTLAVGMDRGIAFQSTHTELEAMLSEQVTIFFEATTHGAH